MEYSLAALRGNPRTRGIARIEDRRKIAKEIVRLIERWEPEPELF